MPKTMRIRTDDQVVIISGKDKGKTGKVLRTEPKKRRVYVEGGPTLASAIVGHWTSLW